MEREHEACVLCRLSFSGPPNQVLCSMCKATPEGKRYIEERRAKNMRAFVLRRKLGIPTRAYNRT
jgi:hypothetical protein